MERNEREEKNKGKKKKKKITEKGSSAPPRRIERRQAASVPAARKDSGSADFSEKRNPKEEEGISSAMTNPRDGIPRKGHAGERGRGRKIGDQSSTEEKFPRINLTEGEGGVKHRKKRKNRVPSLLI